MVLGSELEVIKSQSAYLVDSLRFALSISSYSIPTDTSLGLDLDRSSEIEDVAILRTKAILSEIDSQGRLECSGCFLDKNVIKIIIKNNITNELLQYTLE